MRKLKNKAEEGYKSKIDFIIQYMNENNVKQTDLAQMTGIDRSQLYRIFNHQSTPSSSTMMEITGALGLQEYLIENEGEFFKKWNQQ